jgi:hypothetical protein
VLHHDNFLRWSLGLDVEPDPRSAQSSIRVATRDLLSEARRDETVHRLGHIELG